jgi:peptidoglycan/xylan/chitin deacetylase (PgdA/CDA1 family)
MSHLIDAIYAKNWSAILPKSLVITFDDGHAGNYKLLEVLKRHKIAATIYLCSHIVGTKRHFWDRLKNGRVKVLRLVDNQQLQEILEKDAGFTPYREYPQRHALNREEILEMAEWVEFHSHGRYHFSLCTLDDGTAWADFSESKKMIEELLERPCEHFSFPYGDYTERDLVYLKKTGYKSARTTKPGWNSVNTDPYQLKIVADVAGDASLNLLCAQMSGIPRYLKRYVYLMVTRYIHRITQSLYLRHGRKILLRCTDEIQFQ